MSIFINIYRKGDAISVNNVSRIPPTTLPELIKMLSKTLKKILNGYSSLLNLLPAKDDEVKEVSHDAHAHDDEGHHVVGHKVDGGHSVGVIVIVDAFEGGVGGDDDLLLVQDHAGFRMRHP